MNKDPGKILNIGKSFALVTQIGISILVPIGLCMIGANYLMGKFQVGNWVMILAIVMGIGAGFLNVYKMLEGFYKKKDINK